jgi:hypothetical protein
MRIRLAEWAFIAIASFAAPASALDRQELLTRLEQAAGPWGASAQFGPVEQTADGDFRIAFVEFAGRSGPTRIDAIEIKGAALDANGTLTIARMTFASATAQSETPQGQSVRIVVAGGEASGLHFPDYENPGSPLVGAGPTQWSIGDIVASGDGGATAMTIAGIKGESRPDGATVAQMFATGDIRVNVEELADKDAAATAARLGVGDVRLTARGRASWDTKSGRAELGEFVVDIADLGSLELAAAVSGYTGERARALQKANRQVAKLAETDTLASLDAMKGVMAESGNIKLVSARISFRDGSLTNRLLDWQAKENGQTRAQAAELAAAMAQGYLQALGDAAFADAGAAALRSFLAAPGRLTLSIAPAEPGPVTGLLLMVLASPGDLVSALGLKIEAQ